MKEMTDNKKKIENAAEKTGETIGKGLKKGAKDVENFGKALQKNLASLKSQHLHTNSLDSWNLALSNLVKNILTRCKDISSIIPINFLGTSPHIFDFSKRMKNIKE